LKESGSNFTTAGIAYIGRAIGGININASANVSGILGRDYCTFKFPGSFICWRKTGSRMRPCSRLCWLLPDCSLLSNLVANSLDAIDDGGTIKVRVSAGKDCIRVTLTDNGKGIPAGTVKHIFEPFFTTKDRVGTGLGLWVSQQIIEKHGGKIKVRSSSDGLRKGTTLSVVLPMQPTPAEGLIAVA
jgi:hypothetical protein